MIQNNIKQIQSLQQSIQDMAEDFVIILGPTASGKTKLAVALAQAINAEIISADSRQVYRGMDIGTGKDIQEYGEIPFHLIDIIDPGEKYNVTQFLADFEEAYSAIKSRGKQVIVCGGTGFYLQALLSPRPYAHIPIDLDYRASLEIMSKEEVLSLLKTKAIPSDFSVDFSSKKRMIRALEILEWLEKNPNHTPETSAVYTAKVFGLNPALEVRRERISQRLRARLEQGMIDEVKNLLAAGVTFEDLEYYGLEYKYISYYFQGEISYDDFVKKLETEIHRYAKRQMTYFRKMEKDGIGMNWLK